MQLVLALYFLFAAIYYPCLFIEWVLRKFGVLKPPYESYWFERDVLKPLGFNYNDYHMKPDIAVILRVQKKLSEEFIKRISTSDWRQVQHDLRENLRMEETFIENLKKPLS